MEKKVYASSEEQAVDVLYQRLGKMTLITDKDGKPVRYERQYPSIKQLITNCKKEEIELPKNPKIKDVLLAMVRAGYTGDQQYASADLAIKSLSERVFEKAIKDTGISQKEEAPPATQEAPPAQEEAPPTQRAAEQAKIDLEQSEEDEIEAEIKAEEDSAKEEQAQREADKKATLDKSS